MTGGSIPGLLSVVGSTPTTWYSKTYKSVHTFTLGGEFIEFKTASEEKIILIYHLWSKSMKVIKPSTICFDNMNVILNANNPGISLNKKTVALRYIFNRTCSQ